MDDQLLRSSIEELRVDSRDPDAWENLYRSLYPYVFGTLFRMLHGNAFLAEESVQEVMIRILRSFDFKIPTVTAASLMLYLRRTIRSVALDLYRQEKAHDEGEELSDEILETLSNSSTEDDLIAKIEWKKILEGLSAKESQVACLLLSGHSSSQIADTLSVRNKTASNLSSLVRRRIRKILFNGSGKRV